MMLHDVSSRADDGFCVPATIDTVTRIGGDLYARATE